MQFLNLFLVAAATLSITEACKCVAGSNGVADPAKTQSCCDFLGGTFQFGDDCQADSISGDLSTFASCCRDFDNAQAGGSDCDCPTCFK
jgi:hypothetical protein